MIYWGYIGVCIRVILVLYRDNGKENGNYYLGWGSGDCPEEMQLLMDKIVQGLKCPRLWEVCQCVFSVAFFASWNIAGCIP